MKARIKFRKYGALKFIGHLDVMRYFQKVMRRADIPIAFTGGYSPHMIMSFASPLGIGLTSDGEYLDIELTKSIDSVQAVREMNRVNVEGIEVLSIRRISDDKKQSGMTILSGADYLVSLKNHVFTDDLKACFSSFLEQTEIRVVKQTKRSEQETDIRPLIYHYEIRDNAIYLLLAAGSKNNLKPDLVMEAFLSYAGLQEQNITFAFHRLDLYADDPEKKGKLVTLESLGRDMKENKIEPENTD